MPLLLGVVYLVIGRVFALPTHHVRAWRLAAWLVSGAAFTAQLGYELFTLRQSPRSAAWHVALAAALGAFLLAVAAALHSLATTFTLRPLWLIALVAWPLITAVPAFLVAWVAGAVLGRRRGD